MTFYNFLETLKDEDPPAGDLARDALGDDTYSRQPFFV